MVTPGSYDEASVANELSQTSLFAFCFLSTVELVSGERMFISTASNCTAHRKGITMQKLLNSILRFWLCAVIVSGVPVMTVLGQNQTTKPVVTPAGGQETCDGALDIVPSKSATFQRKRRLAAKKATTKPEPKSENKTVR